TRVFLPRELRPCNRRPPSRNRALFGELKRVLKSLLQALVGLTIGCPVTALHGRVSVTQSFAHGLKSLVEGFAGRYRWLLVVSCIGFLNVRLGTLRRFAGVIAV